MARQVNLRLAGRALLDPERSIPGKIVAKLEVRDQETVKSLAQKVLKAVKTTEESPLSIQFNMWRAEHQVEGRWRLQKKIPVAPLTFYLPNDMIDERLDGVKVADLASLYLKKVELSYGGENISIIPRERPEILIIPQEVTLATWAQRANVKGNILL